MLNSAFQKFQKINRKTLTGWSIGLAAVAFVSANVISDSLLKNARIDLTEDQIFTITKGTTTVLSNIDEPIDIRFYYSTALDQAAPGLNSHVRRVSEILDEYERRSGGKLRITRFDPQPFSQEEDLAVADGLSGIPLGNNSETAYFGLAAINSTDDKESIPYFAPERANYLEYDLTRLIHDLANPEKPVVGIIGDVPFYGTQQNRFQKLAVTERIEESFDLKTLTGDFNRIDEDIDVLMIAQPKELSEEKLYAIDQFAMKGGRILAFVDPHAETLQQASPYGGGGVDTTVETLTPLLKSWGVEIASDRIVGDQAQALRVRADVNGRPTAVDYLPWVGVGPTNLATQDITTGDLQLINLNSAGIIRTLDDAKTTIEPLMTSSPNAMEIEKAEVQFRPDPAKLLAEFEPSGDIYNLAVRLTGLVDSAYKDELPEALQDDAATTDNHLATSEKQLNVILVADSDILADRNWVESRGLFGANFAVQIANNGDFAVNALENLSGSEGLIDLRGRGITNRPFEVIAAMEQDAEQKFRAKEQQLLNEIEETRKKIADLQNEERESGVILTSTQEAEINDFRATMLDLRQELRGVQRSLREDVEGLKGWITAINIWGVPALITLLAIGLAAFQRYRRPNRLAA